MWTDEKKEAAIKDILEAITDGESLRAFIKRSDREVIPALSTFHEWLLADEKLTERYAHAREERAEKIFEEILEIADESSNDIIETENGEITNHEAIQRSRLRVDARKWMLGKMSPKKFGDKLDVTTMGEKITAPIVGMSITNDPNTD